jgi:hypothetical protein
MLLLVSLLFGLRRGAIARAWALGGSRHRLALGPAVRPGIGSAPAQTAQGNKRLLAGGRDEANTGMVDSFCWSGAAVFFATAFSCESGPKERCSSIGRDLKLGSDLPPKTCGVCCCLGLRSGTQAAQSGFFHDRNAPKNSCCEYYLSLFFRGGLVLDFQAPFGALGC